LILQATEKGEAILINLFAPFIQEISFYQFIIPFLRAIRLLQYVVDSIKRILASLGVVDGLATTCRRWTRHVIVVHDYR
jgi:hypothetical protein